MNYADSLNRFKTLNWLDKAELQQELDLFLGIAERVNWEIDDKTLKYMNDLQGAIRAL